MKLKEYYYEWNPHTEEIILTTEKLQELVLEYKEKYRNAKNKRSETLATKHTALTRHQ